MWHRWYVVAVCTCWSYTVEHNSSFKTTCYAYQLVLLTLYMPTLAGIYNTLWYYWNYCSCIQSKINACNQFVTALSIGPDISIIIPATFNNEWNKNTFTIWQQSRSTLSILLFSIEWKLSLYRSVCWLVKCCMIEIYSAKELEKRLVVGLLQLLVLHYWCATPAVTKLHWIH